jgi:hypothetical protein
MHVSPLLTKGKSTAHHDPWLGVGKDDRSYARMVLLQDHREVLSIKYNQNHQCVEVLYVSAVGHHGDQGYLSSVLHLLSVMHLEVEY